LADIDNSVGLLGESTQKLKIYELPLGLLTRKLTVDSVQRNSGPFCAKDRIMSFGDVSSSDC